MNVKAQSEGVLAVEKAGLTEAWQAVIGQATIAI